MKIIHCPKGGKVPERSSCLNCCEDCNARPGLRKQTPPRLSTVFARDLFSKHPRTRSVEVTSHYEPHM
jgi:hypothetical protein